MLFFDLKNQKMKKFILTLNALKSINKHLKHHKIMFYGVLRSSNVILRPLEKFQKNVKPLKITTFIKKNLYII